MKLLSLKRRWRGSIGWPIVAFAFGLCVTVATSLWLQRQVDEQAQAEFQRGADRVAEDITRRFRQPVYGLRGRAGVHATGARISRNEFREYIESRDLPVEFPGVRGFGFIQRVERGELEAFIAAERADNAPHFTVRELQEAGHDDLYVIKYIEPLVRNVSALGLDLGSEQVRRKGIEQAVATGQPTLTGTITLVQDERRSPGFLLYLPLYRRGADPVTLKQRRSALVGLLYAPIVAAEMLADVSDVAAGQVDFELFDVAGEASDEVLQGKRVFDSRGPAAGPAGGGDNASRVSRYVSTETLALPGREMTLRVSSTRAFEASVSQTPMAVRLALGLVLSSLFAGFVRQQLSGRQRAEARAEEMTADLARLALVAQRTSNAVIIMDRERRITWVNDAFTRLYGYSLEQAQGRTPDALVGNPKCPPKAIETLRIASDAVTGCRVELLNRAADGSEPWVDVEVQPARDSRGEWIGFIEVASDITATKRATQELATQRRRLENIVNGTQAGTWEDALESSELRVNETYVGMLGYTLDECTAWRREDYEALIHPDDLPLVTLARSAHLQGLTQDYEAEFRMRHKQGQWVWVQSHGAVTERDDHGEPLTISGIHLDVSKRKLAEQDLARERQRLANVLEGTHVGTWEWNLESGEIVIDERWARLLGHTLAELTPATIETWNSRVHPEDRDNSLQRLREHLAGRVPVYEAEARLRHKDGHWVWTLVRGKRVGHEGDSADGVARIADHRSGWMAGTHMDISERKQAEAALRASASLLDQTGRIAGVGGWEFDLATGLCDWTDQTCRIHDREPGYRPTVEEAMGYYAPELRAIVERAVRNAVATASGMDLELPITTAKGRSIWVRAVAEVETVNGKPARLIGALQDVTARRELEANLRRHAELLEVVLEAMPCGLSVFDANLRLLVGNRELRRLLDLPDSLFGESGTTFEDIIRFNAARGEYGPDPDETAIQAIIDRARQPRAHRFERLRPNGVPLEITGAPMPGGGFVTTYVDISERKRAEAEVTRSAQILSGAIEVIDEGFVLYDPDDRLVFCNDKYREIYPDVAPLMVPGVRFEDLLRIGIKNGSYADAVGREEEWIAGRLAVHRAGNTTIVQRLSNGRMLRIVERKTPDGHIVGFRIDITELMRATEAAQAASQSKSQFLANMSHEIRTPMNAILGMLALLRKTPLTPRQADYASKTEGAARSLLRLLNDILDFSKVEAGKMTLDPHPFRIDQLLRDLSVILSANVGSKRVEVLFDIDPTLPRHLVGDAARLQQVLINLGGNAIKFTSQGEVVVSMTVVQRDAQAVTLEIAVRDTGIGIAPENHARIFSGFTQAEASTTRRFGGTGLGVAISQRLVALMGGELKLESELGRGTRFHFCITLPLAAAGAGEGEVASEAAEAGERLALPRATRPMRALVVDDNPTAREVLHHMGESLGWTVDVAESGEQALALLQQQAATGVDYQAVFVDWQMPGLDGWQTSQRIRELGLSGSAPVVVMVTAHGREMLAQRSEAEQALLNGFLVKPVTASMLFDAIADARPEYAQPDASRRAAAPVGPRLVGLRLLVVEDNPNNQQVARELLEDEGAIVQLASHGQEAVEAVAAAEPMFDVVLMDLQMPVMDGITATQRIRQDLQLTRLPIVAMTANAMASDRDACLAAGMNDHVGKPFDLDHLVSVLLHQAGRKPLPAEPAERAAAADAPLAAAVSEAALAGGVDMAAALNRLGGKVELYQRMLGSFVKDLAAMPQQLREQGAAGEPVVASRTLHTLKGQAATLGATALSAAAAQGEKRLAGGAQGEDAAEAIELACAAIGQAAPGLAALHAALQAAGAPQQAASSEPLAAGEVQALAAALRALAELLQNADMAATDAIAEIRRRWGGTLGEQAQLLDEAIGRLDFEHALTLCRQLIEGQAS